VSPGANDSRREKAVKNAFSGLYFQMRVTLAELSGTELHESSAMSFMPAAVSKFSLASHAQAKGTSQRLTTKRQNNWLRCNGSFPNANGTLVTCGFFNGVDVR
jgi:hypothetical protein